MKRLVVCCDGTWNNPEQEDNGAPAPTNVFKIYNAIAESDPGAGVPQLKYYHPGVGGEGGFIDSIRGGAVGVGVSRHIVSAYHWIASNYEEGDHIYLYGFSRGAFVARSLGGFLGRGLLDLRGLEPVQSWNRVQRGYDKGYRVEKAEKADWVAPGWRFFHDGDATPIRFIGVWDTVGALGVPDDLEILNFLDNRAKWQFHNTALGLNVGTARHAMAIDEIRSSFSITRWKNAAEHPDAKEVWFPGVHSNVGGGYGSCDLSNGALLWMMKESVATGLKFREGTRETLKTAPLGTMHNSFKCAFSRLRCRPRNIDAMVEANRHLFHDSAFKRQKASPIAYPAYHPTRILDLEEEITVEVFADTRWNYTGIYLEQGQSFTFSATGEWQDGKDTCTWKGAEDGNRTPADILRATASFVGQFEDLFKKLTGNQATDFIGTRRVETIPWFSLVGAIANDAGSKDSVANDGSPVAHERVELSKHETTPLEIKNPGYLYCFANDAWCMYGNNQGSLRLTIRRVK